MSSKLIKIFISSSNNSEFDGKSLTESRKKLKGKIEDILIGNEKLFEVLINEKEINGMDESIWETCIRWAQDCNLFLFIDNGSAGSKVGETKIGILHAELISAKTQNAKKIRGFSIQSRVKSSDKQDIEYANFISDYVIQKNIGNYMELEKNIILAIHKYLLDVFHSGIICQKKQLIDKSAIEWKNMTYSTREEKIKECLEKEFNSYQSSTANIKYEYHAYPDSIAIAESKEKVGQPFLKDYLLVEIMNKHSQIGPVHIIGCYGGITESQVKKILGFNDAIILKSSFGIYVADRVSQIQMIFIEKCQNEDLVKNNVASFFNWIGTDIKEEKMDEKIKQRAAKRKEIVAIMYNNLEK